MSTFIVTFSLPRSNMLGKQTLFVAMRSAVLEEIASLVLALAKNKQNFTLEQIEEMEALLSTFTDFLEEERQFALSEPETEASQA